MVNMLNSGFDLIGSALGTEALDYVWKPTRNFGMNYSFMTTNEDNGRFMCVAYAHTLWRNLYLYSTLHKLYGDIVTCWTRQIKKRCFCMTLLLPYDIFTRGGNWNLESFSY